DVFAKSNKVSTNIFFAESEQVNVSDWVEKRTRPGKLWKINGHLSGIVRATFNQAYVPPRVSGLLLLQSSPIPQHLCTTELACRNGDGMRVVEFKKLKRKRPLLDHE